MKKLHAFVTMPFGKKTGPDGTAIGFNAVNKNKLPKPFVEPAFIQKSIFRSVQFLRERNFKLKPQMKAASIESGGLPKLVEYRSMVGGEKRRNK